MSTAQLQSSWLRYLEDEFRQDYMLQLKSFLQAERQRNNIIYPPGRLTFNALNPTPLDRVKGVLLGQDPCHGAGQAHGLSFSVQKGIPIPPSLKSIYKEINSDLGWPLP